jgi:acetyl-CoA carboxylase biotin carboxyl carrier protein
VKAPRTRRRDKAPPPPVDRAAAGARGEGLAREVAELAELMRTYELSELEVERDGLRVLLRRGAERPHLAAPTMAPAAPPAPTPPPVAAAPAAVAAAAPPAPRAETSDGNISYITSPFVGTFYRSPGPDSAPFVDVGTHVKKGQVLCIVEAMKLMNEIESEVDGTIVQLLVENGQPVEYGEPLFKIKQD